MSIWRHSRIECKKGPTQTKKYIKKGPYKRALHQQKFQFDNSCCQISVLNTSIFLTPLT